MYRWGDEKHSGVVCESATELANICSLPLVPDIELGTNCKRDEDGEEVIDGSLANLRDVMSNRSSWADSPPGTNPVEYAEKQLRQGWSAGTKRVFECARDVQGAAIVAEQSVESVRFRRHRGDYGDDLDAERMFLDGDVDRAWTYHRKSGAGMYPVVTIVSPWGGDMFKTGEELAWTSIPGLVLSEILERNGYRVCLINACVARMSGHVKRGRAVSAVVVKAPEERLVINNVAAVATSPTVFRTFGIRSLDSTHVNVDYGYGSPAAAVVADIPEYLRGDDPILLKATYSKEAAIEEINKHIGRFQSSLTH